MFINNISTALWALLSAALVGFLVNAYLPQLILQWRLRHIPIANKKRGEWSDQKAIDRAQTNAMQIIKNAYVKYRGRPFQLISQVGRRVILPPRLIDSVKSDDRFSSSESLRVTTTAINTIPARSYRNNYGTARCASGRDAPPSPRIAEPGSNVRLKEIVGNNCRE
ncbi:hypothetical protein LY78DRAFT_660201 [Colletotrichum sublineola]|nr:hypothetical protein LY78DRAFT_660201 [Colletotrichum sublineola]